MKFALFILAVASTLLPAQDTSWAQYDFPVLTDSNRYRFESMTTSGLTDALGLPAPPLRYVDISDSTTHSLDELRGNVVLLNFWSRSCRPCIQEMPDLSDIQDAYEGSGFRLLFLALDDMETQRRFFEVSRYSGIKGIVSTSQLYKPYQATVIPMSLLIDRSGVVTDGWYGLLDQDELEERINQLVPASHKKSISPYIGGVFTLVVVIAGTAYWLLKKRAMASAA